MLSQDQVLIKHLERIRHERGLSLDDVATRSGISRATLSRIERGQTSPTTNTLGKLCSAYHVTMSSLMVAVESDAPRHIRFKQADMWTDPESGFRRTVVSPPAHNYQTEMAFATLPPGTDILYTSAPIEGLEQHIFLLEGELTLTFNDLSYELQALDCLALKLHGASRFQNLGSVNARYLVVNTKI